MFYSNLKTRLEKKENITNTFDFKYNIFIFKTKTKKGVKKFEFPKTHLPATNKSKKV